MRRLLLAALAFTVCACGDRSQLVDVRLQAYRYVLIERADEVAPADGDFAAELAAELTRSGFTVVDAQRIETDQVAGDEALQCYARMDDGVLSRVDVALRDYRSGEVVWAHHDKSGTRGRALSQCLERLRLRYGAGFSQREADLKRQRASR